MPTLVYKGKEYEISQIDAEWLKNLAIGVKHRIEALEKAVNALKKSLVKVVLDGQELLVPRGAVMEVIRREELEKLREKTHKEIMRKGHGKERPPIELPIRKPPEQYRYYIPEPWLRKRAPPVTVQPIPIRGRALFEPVLRPRRARMLLLARG